MKTRYLNHPRRGLVYPPWRSACTLDALRRAWLAVRANKGGGAHGETLVAFEQQLETHLADLRDELLSGRYRANVVKRIYVPKRNEKWRPITLWHIRDRIAQRAVYDYLEPLWDPRFLDCSYGFRQNRTTAGAAKAIVRAYRDGYTWVVDADITDCFGNMRSRRVRKLLGEWRVPTPLQQLIGGWLETRIVNARLGGRQRAGLSQGGVISPLLCNLYLHSFDRGMQQRNWRLVRYADDFVVLATAQKHAEKAQRHAAHLLGQVGLTINEHKSRLVHFDAGFQFVGWFFVRGETFELK